MDLQVLIGAVAKELRAARSKVGESSDLLLGSQCRCPIKVDFFLLHFVLPLVRR